MPPSWGWLLFRQVTATTKSHRTAAFSRRAARHSRRLQGFYGRPASQPAHRGDGDIVNRPATGWWRRRGIFSFTAPFDGSMGGHSLTSQSSAWKQTPREAGIGSSHLTVASSTSGPPASSAPPSLPLPLVTGPNPAPQAATCSITLSDYSPVDGEEETATISSNQANSSVSLKKTYKTVTSYDNGETDSAGSATINFNISGATVGYTVHVTATVGGASCSTSFTPR